MEEPSPSDRSSGSSASVAQQRLFSGPGLNPGLVTEVIRPSGTTTLTGHEELTGAIGTWKQMCLGFALPPLLKLEMTKTVLCVMGKQVV